MIQIKLILILLLDYNPKYYYILNLSAYRETQWYSTRQGKVENNT